MIRLRPAALILLAALPGAAWAACNPVGTEDCCTKVVTEECTSADWPLPGDIETSLTEDGRPRFILTGMPDSARYYGIRHETWIPVEPRITCPPDRETPIEGDIRTFVSWEMTTNDVVVATGFNTEAVVPDGISGLVRCDFEVHSFAGVCDEHSTGYTHSATVVRLEVTGGIVPRHSTNPEEWPELECMVMTKGTEQSPVSVTLAGSKIRFEPGHVTSKTISVSGSDVFSISGQTQSETMWDASVNATAHTDFGDISTNAAVTVVWVQPITIRTTPGESFSPNNQVQYRPHPDSLGARFYYMTDETNIATFIGYVVEIAGQVHPADFSGNLLFARDNTAMWQDVTCSGQSFPRYPLVSNTVQRLPIAQRGNDAPPRNCMSTNVVNGFIFDYDAPGCYYDSLVLFPPGTQMFLRYNFVEYAIWESSTAGFQRCSDDFPWHVRITTTNMLYGPITVTNIQNRPGHPDDNSAGPGHTKMGRDE